MARCVGSRADGATCGAQAISGSSYCINHHPDYEDARQRRASKGGKRGGRGRGQTEIADVRAEIRAAIKDVRSGELDAKAAAVMFQGYNTLLRAIEAERGWKLEDLERELSALEDHVAGLS